MNFMPEMPDIRNLQCVILMELLKKKKLLNHYNLSFLAGLKYNAPNIIQCAA